MLGFMWWLIIGLVAGGLARFLIPGSQPMGLWMTLGLGLVGSFIGGLISSVVFGYDMASPGVHASGLFMSTVGAVVALAGYLAVARRGAWRD